MDVRFEKRVGLSEAWVKEVLSETLRIEKRKAVLDVLLTGDRQIRRINKKFLNHDYATDVISFGHDDGMVSARPRASLIGHIIVSVDTAKTVSRELGIPFKEEVARYLVHGTLHLLGYDDKKPADFKRMHTRQEAILQKIL